MATVIVTEASQTSPWPRLFFSKSKKRKTKENQKVLLRERKRHTVRRVASARQVRGGYPSPGPGGYPVPGLEGTLSQVWGYPIPGPGGGVPHPDLVGGYPRYPHLQTWDGVPPPPCLDLGWGTPPARPGMGYPPPARPGMGYPPARLGMGYPPRPDWGTPRDVNWQTNWKQYLPPSFGCGR